MAEEQVSDGDELQSKVVEVMSKHPNGVTNQIIIDAIPGMTTAQLVACVNKLLAQHKVQLLKKGATLVYKLKDKNYQGNDIEEKIIFDAIERAGNNGVASKDLKFQTQMTLPQINRSLKNLESKKLIKSVTSTSRKKLFMLYDLEPSNTVTGGTFYTGEEFESEFVDVLADQCYKYLVQAKAIAEKQLFDPVAQRNASFKSSKDVCDYINGLKISKVNLSQKDIDKILEALVYDDKVEKLSSLSKSKSSVAEILYRCSRSFIDSAGVMMVPCGACNVYMNCHVNGEISPATCAYMKDWLDF